jgi:hypothetical protein
LAEEVEEEEDFEDDDCAAKIDGKLRSKNGRKSVHFAIKTRAQVTSRIVWKKLIGENAKAGLRTRVEKEMRYFAHICPCFT